MELATIMHLCVNDLQARFIMLLLYLYGCFWFDFVR